MNWTTLGLSTPIIQAPMAGGYTTPALVAAVSRAGGLGSFGCAYIDPDAIRRVAKETRALTDAPFAMNLFVHPDVPEDAAALERAHTALASIRRDAGLKERAAVAPRIDLEKQFAAVLESAPSMLSTVFGVPSRAMIDACHERGIRIAATVTTLEEGIAVDGLGLDAIIAQGGEAGGHRGTFLGEWETSIVGTLPLVSMLSSRLRTPIVAAGGIMDGRAIRAVLDAGAVAAQLGTAFLLCPEAGTAEPHRRMLRAANPRPTIVSPVYTGRAARGIRNRFADELASLRGATPPFDVMNALTRDLRKASADRDDPEWMSLWAGQGYPLARALPAAELVRELLAEGGF